MKLTLIKLKEGGSRFISSIRTGRGRRWGFRKRLDGIGLTPGTRITVVKMLDCG